MPENWKTMTREEFLLEMDEILGAAPWNPSRRRETGRTPELGLGRPRSTDCPRGNNERCAHLSRYRSLAARRSPIFCGWLGWTVALPERQQIADKSSARQRASGKKARCPALR